MTPPTCRLCGNPMPEGEEMFKYHGYSGPCPPKAKAMTTLEERIENMAKGEYQRGHGQNDPTWDAAPFDTRRTYTEWAKMNITDFLEGDPLDDSVDPVHGRTTDMNVADYATLAAAWTYAAVERFTEDGWEANGDIGQYDYERICELMLAMVPQQPDRDTIEAAYRRFAEAAAEWEKDE